MCLTAAVHISPQCSPPLKMHVRCHISVVPPWASKPHRVAMPMAILALKLAVLDGGEAHELIRKLKRVSFDTACRCRSMRGV